MRTQHLLHRRILVTGGTGFVGRHLLPLLVEAGADVTVACRGTSRTEHLPAGVTTVRVDLRTGEGLDAAIRGSDIVIHMAALLFGLGWQDYLRSNSAAAQSLARAVETAGNEGPSRFVLVSSLSASGPCASPEGVRDDAPGLPVSAYGWSKLLSENILGRACGDRLVTLRPPIIYGSGDKGLLPVYKGLQHGVAALPGMGRTFTVSAIHADDMARAIILACLPEAHGIYHLSDGNAYSMADFYRQAAQALGCKARIIGVPLWIMRATAALSTFWGVLTGAFGARRAPNWNTDKYLEAREAGWVGSNARISEELGFMPEVSLAQGMEETMEGNRKLGLL